MTFSNHLAPDSSPPLAPPVPLWSRIIRRVSIFVIVGSIAAFCWSVGLAEDEVLQIGGNHGPYWERVPALAASGILIAGSAGLLAVLGLVKPASRAICAAAGSVLFIGAVVALTNMHFPNADGEVYLTSSTQKATDGQAYALGYLTGESDPASLSNGACMHVWDAFTADNTITVAQQHKVLDGCVDAGLHRTAAYPEDVKDLEKVVSSASRSHN